MNAVRSCSALPKTVVYFTFFSGQVLFGQTQTTPASQTADREEIHRLNTEIAAQAQKITDQAQQLSALQAQIATLQSGLADQKALLEQLLQASGSAMASRNSAGMAEIATLVPPGQAGMSELAAVLPLIKSSPSLPAQPEQQVPPQESVASAALAQEQQEQTFVKEAPKKWYDKLSERGYMQFRYNNLFASNPNYKCDQCDKSIGPDNGFFLRRMRLVIFGDISDHLSVYLQPDFASSSGSSQNYAQLRDAYFDISFDPEKAHRIRVGLSKIPYGFDDLQSSQNRLDLDRDDAINSSHSNERDIGVFYYWAPPNIRARFAELTKTGLKGTGDYGEFGAGVYNG